MGNNVINFPAGNGAVQRSLEKYQAEHEDKGRKAGKVLASSKKRLSWEDRASIARRLHDEILASGIKPGRVAAAARLANGTRELNKLAMRDGKDPRKAQLLAHPDRYYDLIKAFARLTRQNLHLVVDRITVGTAVHPTRASQLSDVEKTFRALELLADRVDRKLGLFDQYRQTFLKKRELQSRGDLKDWPFYEKDDDIMPTEPKLAHLNLTKKSLKAIGYGSSDPSGIPLSDVDASLFDENGRDYIRHCLQRYEEDKIHAKKILQGIYAFWNVDHDDYAEGMVIEALAFLPHAYLGIFEDWSYWGIKNDMAVINETRKELLPEYKNIPTASWLAKEDKVLLQAPEDTNWYQVGHTWLLLYPDRHLTTIVPVLLRTTDDIGSQVERVTIGKLIELQSAEFIAEQPMSAYERLVEVVGEKTEEGSKFALAESWIKTGVNFQNNPYLRAVQRSEKLRAERDTLFAEETIDEH